MAGAPQARAANVTLGAGRAARRFLALCCALILAAIWQAPSALAQTPTYFGAPDCYGPTGAVPCHIHMQNFGGPVMTGPTDVYSLFYGDWSSYGSSVQTLANFFTDLNGSTYLNLMSLYGASTDIEFRGSYFTSAYEGTILTDGKLDQIVRNFAYGSVPAETNAVYFVFTAPNVRLNPDDHGACAFHTNLGSLKYAWASGYDAQPSVGCDDTFTDTLVSDASHELFEALTDPFVAEATTYGPPLAWSDANTGDEIVDPCENTDFRGTLNGHSYALQPVFVNDSSYAAGGYCSSGLPFAKAASVPEPSTWALIIGGAAITGAVLRQRRRRGLEAATGSAR